MAEKLGWMEQHAAAGYLRRATPIPNMEFPILEAIWQAGLFPMSPIELFILDKPVTAESELRVLLARRSPDDPYFPNAWHHPGGYLGGRKKISEAIQGITMREIGVPVKNIMFVGITNNFGLARDHELAIMIVCELERTLALKKGYLEFFPVDNLPQGTLPHHQLMQEKVNRWVAFVRLAEKISPEFLKVYLQTHSILESDLEK